MKTQISFLFFMLNFLGAFCQYPFSNNLNDDIIDIFSTKGVSINCSRSSSAFVNKYNKLTYYIPNANTPIKTIKLNFNIFQDDNGLNNFPDNSTTRDRFNNIIYWLNNFYSSNCQPSDPISGVAFIADTRIRFELQGIYFYKDSILQSSTNLFPLFNTIKNTEASRVNQLNVCFTEGQFFASGYASFPSFTDMLSDIGVLTFKKYNNGNNVGDYACAYHFAHELGHCLDLFHPYDGNNTGIYGDTIIVNGDEKKDACCPESCNVADNDFLDDVFDLNGSNWCNHQSGCSVCYHQGGWDMDPFSSSNFSTNNIMGGDASGCYFSPKQMGKIHRALVMSSARRYLKDCPNNFNNVVISSTEVWDFNMKLDGNISIGNLGSLNLTCGVEMPDGGRVNINPGGQLLVSANIINSCGNGWSGIFVQSGGYLELNSTTISDYSIVVNSGGTLRIQSGLTISGNNHIVVESGAFICIESGSSIQLSDFNSVINLKPGYINGVNPSLGITSNCAASPSTYTTTGSGKINTFLSDVYIQDTTLTGNQYIPGNTISAGTNVTNTKPQGPVLVESASNIVFDAYGNNILDNGFEVEEGAFFEIK